MSGEKFFPPSAREFHHGGRNKKSSSLQRPYPASEPNYSFQGRSPSGQGIGTQIRSPSSSGGSQNQRVVTGKVVLTLSIMETYPWVRYFMTQRRADMSATGVLQLRAFLQVARDFLDDWGRSDKELEKKVKRLISQGKASVRWISGVEAQVVDLKLAGRKTSKKLKRKSTR